ncbi:hypothetical protein ED312_10220 [Sinomicrobium pectinilyticum]|uniref:Tail specific protease domain-containing protein n=1 Tax=Sinomicrobium pectinilyticum TaxID=1084421 RepID=A0A3N0EHM8_SINP1|nr:S41 family peptidase [Sinomicrobium pectinilyticum]RNL87179.1 hypothetical protein ED312_10220 [Sinomicrobium pectinilyticum]
MKFQCIIICMFATSIAAYTQSGNLTNAHKKEIIDSINYQLKDKYVLEKMADLMAKDLLKRHKRGEYKTITDKTVFADSLKSHLFTVSRDKHIGVAYDEEKAARLRSPSKKEDPAEKFNRVNERVRKFNYGFEELKILENNIGYIKITAFAPTLYGGKTASSAMQFVSNCDALIFDLRNNFGGDPTMIQLLISYLYSDEPVHLIDFYHKKENTTTQSWTLPYVDGERMPNVPVYVLTDHKTISAGEEFAYDLKNLGRATIVGETTAGAANFGEEFNSSGNFIVWVPTGKAISPITKTNWEGKGVEPNVKVKANEALDTAYKLALEKINPNLKSH